MNNQDTEIKRLQKRVRKLEAALKIVTTHSGKTESQMQRRFVVVSETIPVSMIISNEKGEILFANLNAQKTFGYSSEEFKEIEISSLCPELKSGKSIKEILYKDGGIDSFRADLRRSHASSLFPAELFSRQLNFDGQNCILTIVHDLTEIMALEKQLRQTQKMEAITTLTSGIAHDFNNILGAILGYTDLIYGSLKLKKRNEKNLDYLEKVQKSANRAQAMVRQMLAFCRKSEKDKQLFYIHSVVTEVAKMMSQLTASNIEIRSDIKNPHMMVTGDTTQVHQILTNLMTNAVYALSEHGGIINVVLQKTETITERPEEILILESQAGPYAKLTVSDNGPGIDQEILCKLFEPFFTTKPVGQGSGLGLAVVDGIIRGHGGAVSVENKPGKGTCFHCYFPLTEQVDEQRILVADRPIIGRGEEHILLVDDEPMILEVCTEMLQDRGYQITSCLESTRALEFFNDRPDAFDLVILDNTMPEMSGLDLAGEIRKIRPSIPIVLMSGNLLLNATCLEKADLQALIQKPFELEEFQRVIRSVLNEIKEE